MTKAQHKRQALSQDDLITRYGYLLSVIPRGVADHAHVEVFGELSRTQREGLLEEVVPLLPEAWGAATSEDPQTLAALMRDVLPRDAMLHSEIGGAVANRFIASAPVAAYFTAGAGSVSIDQQPAWVQALIDHESNPIDAGNMHHRKGVNSGHWF
ncbi:hypothetical protein [Microbacterium pumilum]|uniref:Uncharacterized protein n=1 Tax=Microbacterium pumilum TaxID=344165 RepID=A0ABN2SAL4_9MICO